MLVYFFAEVHPILCKYTKSKTFIHNYYLQNV